MSFCPACKYIVSLNFRNTVYFCQTSTNSLPQKSTIADCFFCIIQLIVKSLKVVILSKESYKSVYTIRFQQGSAHQEQDCQGAGTRRGGPRHRHVTSHADGPCRGSLRRHGHWADGRHHGHTGADHHENNRIAGPLRLRRRRPPTIPAASPGHKKYGHSSWFPHQRMSVSISVLAACAYCPPTSTSDIGQVRID